MGANEDKTKFSIWVDTQLLELADSCIGNGAARNRTELIGDALRFYLGYLMAGKTEDYLLQSLSSAVSGTVQDSENRLARMDFKIAVELSKLSQVIAYTHDVDAESLGRLHAKCVEEVEGSRDSLPSTTQQKDLIRQIVRDFPSTKEMLEYTDFLLRPTIGNASEFISCAMEQNLDLIGKRKNYVDYIANHPRVERLGDHGLFTDARKAQELPHRAKAVYMYLKDRGNKEGQCYPAIGTVARELQLSRRTEQPANIGLVVSGGGMLEKFLHTPPIYSPAPPGKVGEPFLLFNPRGVGKVIRVHRSVPPFRDVPDLRAAPGSRKTQACMPASHSGSR